MGVAMNGFVGTSIHQAKLGVSQAHQIKVIVLSSSFVGGLMWVLTSILFLVRNDVLPKLTANRKKP
ncbi:hypothetical protein ACE6H2_025166 [Prunus campanulata]